MDGRRHARRWATILVLGICAAGGATRAEAADASLTVRRRPSPAEAPPVRSQLLPGAPIPWSGSPLLTPPDLSIVDGETRFLTAGPAQAHCPGDAVVFVPGVVNAYRPTVPGDGAFMCRGDAVAQDFIGP